jgi:hypothetical protein
MNRVKKFIHGDVMGRIYPLNLAQLPRFKQDVDIIYTDGKSDPIWRDITEDAGGVVIRADALLEKQLFMGIVAIDLDLCLPRKPTASLSLSSSGGVKLNVRSAPINFAEFRRKVFEIVAHEYFHLVQAWIIETKKRDSGAFEKVYTKEHWRAMGSVTSQDLTYLFRPDALKARAYLRNRFESSARSMSEAATHRLSAEIDRGAWDAILPIPEMRAIANRG